MKKLSNLWFRVPEWGWKPERIPIWLLFRGCQLHNPAIDGSKPVWEKERMRQSFISFICYFFYLLFLLFVISFICFFFLVFLFSFSFFFLFFIFRTPLTSHDWASMCNVLKCDDIMPGHKSWIKVGVVEVVNLQLTPVTDEKSGFWGCHIAGRGVYGPFSQSCRVVCRWLDHHIDIVVLEGTQEPALC